MEFDRSEPTFHHFTVDVEEYFHAGALEPYVDRSDWDAMESRVEASVDELLLLMDEAGCRGTFFILGWVAQRHPEMVRRIAGAGHEIASHGWGHRRVGDLGPEAFRTSVHRSKRVLEDLTGIEVAGYRAPNFSVVPGVEWALDVLLEEGYRYDSSIFPVRRPGYGYPSAQRHPHRLRTPSGTIAEFPLATLRFLGLTLPAAGGAYFRVLPYGLVRSAFRSATRQGVPATFYIHPWELDPGQPRLPVSTMTRVRQYAGVSGVRDRLRRFLAEFHFRTLGAALEETSPARTTPEPAPALV